MPSPFPGMDPYLEDPVIWPEFHTTYLHFIRSDLNRVLPQRYLARVDRHVWVDEDEAEPRYFGRPDVAVIDTLNHLANESAAVLAAPATAQLPEMDTEGKLFVKIIDAQGKRVVTVIELLSPSNKSPGRGYERYLHKRHEYLAARINLVEIDLLRAGERPPFESSQPLRDYYVLVSRESDYPAAGIWPLSVRNALPAIRVPLGPGEDPVPLDLQSCLQRAYDDGRFAGEVDYESPPIPPLAGADADWAHELLARRRADGT